MSKAVTCPVCNGTGWIDEDYPGAGKSDRRTCHGCGGKGWVEVAEDNVPYIPYYPPCNPEPYYPWYPYPTTAPWSTTTCGNKIIGVMYDE